MLKRKSRSLNHGHLLKFSPVLSPRPGCSTQGKPWWGRHLPGSCVPSASIMASHQFQKVRQHLMWVRLPQRIAGSAQTLPDRPQIITLRCFVLVSKEIWISRVSSHQVCALKSRACGAPSGTGSSQIWFVFESRCQTQMPSHQKPSRSTWMCFRPWWASLLQVCLFQRCGCPCGLQFISHIKNWE